MQVFKGMYNLNYKDISEDLIVNFNPKRNMDIFLDIVNEDFINFVVWNNIENRKYSKTMVNEHLSTFYGVSNDLLPNGEDVLEENGIYVRNMISKRVSGTRNGYYKFTIDNNVRSMCIDANVHHHIFPLVFGGTNDFENISFINSYAHDLLHKNPKEHIEKYCHLAHDLLQYCWYYSYYKVYIEDARSIEDSISEGLRLRNAFNNTAKINMEVDEFVQKLLNDYAESMLGTIYSIIK